MSNSAGPVMNTYLVGLGLGKDEQVGTSAWFYFVVNLSKIPFYLALGAWTTGGSFFTGESLLWNLCLVPAIVVGVYLGRACSGTSPSRRSWCWCSCCRQRVASSS